ncbi:hypothetical protein Nepgr_009687 [Nepenthes gracilis]|uniref:Uncharacterized protein n=1 Tax=Nepenthes gracilis TaxID=150966 RepID=A0AAD3SBR4_NEPGR|nr:hypothetical protein Nepgr_009687 [Nepenthes gracilis]
MRLWGGNDIFFSTLSFGILIILLFRYPYVAQVFGVFSIPLLQNYPLIGIASGFSLSLLLAQPLVVPCFLGNESVKMLLSFLVGNLAKDERE